MEYARMHKLKATRNCAAPIDRNTKPIRCFKCFHDFFLSRFALKMAAAITSARHDSDSDNRQQHSNYKWSKINEIRKKAFEVSRHTHTHVYRLCVWERRVRIGVISRFAKSKYWKLRIDDHMVTNWCLQFVFALFCNSLFIYTMCLFNNHAAIESEFRFHGKM